MVADRVHFEDGILVLSGEVDVAVKAQLRQAVDDACNQGVRVLRVDMHRCEFIDSTAVGQLFHALRLGLELVVQRPPEKVRKVLDISGLLMLAEIED